MDLSEVHIPDDVAERCVKKRRASAAAAAAGKRTGKSNGGLMLRLLRFNAKVGAPVTGMGAAAGRGGSGDGGGGWNLSR